MLTTVLAALLLAANPPSTSAVPSATPLTAAHSSAVATEDNPSAQRLSELKETIELRNAHRARMHAAGAKNRAQTQQLMTQWTKMLQQEAKLEAMELSAEQRAMRNNSRQYSVGRRR
jgi:hypothetical protein